MRLRVPAFPLCAGIFVSACALFAQSIDTKLFADMKWREIGPYRAGRTRALAGVPSQPYTFYIGAVNGGVWKTTDAGQTWESLFDDQPTGSVGALAVAESDPNIIYVGSGEGLIRPDLSVGDGIYKSTDGGKTWTHLGLRDGQQIPYMAVDPKNPNRLFVAVLGHPYGPNEERGIFRSTDGGQTFEKVLYKGPDVGGSDVKIDPSNPNVIWAGMWETRQGPWENAAWSGTGGGLFQSADGGSTWKQISGHGLPDGIVQTDVTISPSDSKRIYATVAAGRGVGLYRSDDGGENWTKTTDDPRPTLRIGGGDLPVPKVDPKNPDVIYVCSTVTWRSTDAGKTWFGVRGAPGGDDYQSLWINPNDTKILLLTSDQGGIVSLNGGVSWTTWYNQPTAQMFHVTVDNAFPWRACGGQQDSGSACVANRSNDGEITFHDWHPVGIEEYGTAAPDPLNPDVVYGGKVTRYDRRTGQIAEVEPKPLRDYRVVRTQPLIFSQANPHVLFFGANTIFKTLDRGDTWTEISPDLTRKTWELPATVGKYSDTPQAKPVQRGVVYAIAPSPLSADKIWAGTDDGLIWLTSDSGKNWNNVTPPQLKPWWKVSIMDASHFDSQTAYAAINTLRLDDMRPHLFRTHDNGKTWTEINNGIPDGAPTDVIREDPKRKGLLFAGTETQVYVSFDDGDHWQSLRLNMPASSVRDLQIKGDDVVVATHGRGFLVLDDITPLRQISMQMTQAAAYLYKPETALRIRGDMNPPTPWPPEVPAGKNPPDGAIIDYYLGENAAGPVSLEILDSAGKVVRHYASTDPVPQLPAHYSVPLYWARPPQVLSDTPGHHRFIWDVHYAPVPGMDTGPDADQAVPHNTPSAFTSPWVLPGTYTIKLTANGQTYTQSLAVTMDPRVKTPLADLQAQFQASKQLYEAMLESTTDMDEISALQKRVASNEELNKQLQTLLGPIGFGRGGGFGGGANAPTSFSGLRAQLSRLLHEIQSADVAPTRQQSAACAKRLQDFKALRSQWNTLKAHATS
jgi:photosystem II stability/assembly factor-like uncharacterized protein